MDAREARLGRIQQLRCGLRCRSGRGYRLGWVAEFITHRERPQSGEFPAGSPRRIDVQTQFFSGITPRGTPVAERRDSAIDVRWTSMLPRTLSPTTGTRCTGLVPSRLVAMLFSVWELRERWLATVSRWQAADRSMAQGIGRGDLAPVSLSPGSRHAIRLEYSRQPATRGLASCGTPERTDRSTRASTVPLH